MPTTTQVVESLGVLETLSDIEETDKDVIEGSGTSLYFKTPDYEPPSAYILSGKYAGDNLNAQFTKR